MSEGNQDTIKSIRDRMHGSDAFREFTGSKSKDYLFQGTKFARSERLVNPEEIQRLTKKIEEARNIVFKLGSPLKYSGLSTFIAEKGNLSLQANLEDEGEERMLNTRLAVWSEGDIAKFFTINFDGSFSIDIDFGKEVRPYGFTGQSMNQMTDEEFGVMDELLTEVLTEFQKEK